MLLPILLSALLPAIPVHEGCSSSAAHASAAKNVVETAAAAGAFRTLVAAVEAAGLADALSGDGPFTVFAPTDAAFAALPKGTLASLLEPKNKATLRAILAYHVVPAGLDAKRVGESGGAATLNGQRIDFHVDEGAVRVDGARVTQADLRCSNGIVHVIDAVLLPSALDLVATAAGDGGLATLAKAIEAAGLVEALKGEGPYTVFAPTDAAFVALPAGTLASLLEPKNREKLAAILKLHVVPGRVYADAAGRGAEVRSLSGATLQTRSEGGAVLVQGARVVRADIEATNGVVHVIDRVLLP
jgi:uncharacterized surface protein with fasciclin (FAS1) repeats